MRRLPTAFLLFALGATAPLAAQRPVPSPAAVLGFEPGTERRLVEWDSLVRYFQLLDAASDRLRVRTLGRTTNGAPFLAVFISSPANLARLPALREIQRRLADPRTVRDSAEAARLLAQSRAFVLITSSIHSTEVGGFFTPLQIAYRLASSRSPGDLAILDRTVIMLVPSMNPDGVNIVSRWYNQTLGTPAEGAAPPELYHPYVGHDNNRDWYAFTQVETRLVVDSLYGIWHPQVTMDIHQMGQAGARIFLPPYLDPVEPNVDPILVQSMNALGLEVARRMTLEGLTGVSVNSTYDAWTPSRAYQHYHGAVRILTETASAQLATSITMPADSLRAGSGLRDPNASSWNFVAPWPGGRWTLADIVRYQTSGAMAMLDHVARNHDQWKLTSFRVLERASRGWDGWPYAFVIPAANQDQTALAALLEILRRGQVEVRVAREAFTLDGTRYSPGTWVVVLRQPYAAFAKTLLERQQYPDLREYPGGPPLRPYDVTAHTLPLLLGVRVVTATDSLTVPLAEPSEFPVPVYRAAGLSSGGTQRPVRLGLYRSWAASMDEGWTRWVLDTYGIPYESLTDSIARAGNLGGRYDAVVLPDQSPRDILEGLPRRYPARYAGGLGQAGVQALRDFVDGGGTLIALNDACAFAITALELPVTDALASLSSRDFYAPGSIFRLRLDPSSPLAEGMPEEATAWFEGGPVFDVRDPARVRVVGRYPTAPGDVLLSGWVLGAGQVAGKAGLVEVRRGRGRVVLFGFRPQYRGQTMASYPLLFNAIRTSAQ
jgi:hypothetical protein